jgi:hypothetical protein
MKNGAMADMGFIAAATAAATRILFTVLLLPGDCRESDEPLAGSKIARLKIFAHSLDGLPTNTLLQQATRPMVIAELQDDPDESDDEAGEDKKEDQKEDDGVPDRLWDAVKRG